MKGLKRIAALALSIVMVFSMYIPAFSSAVEDASVTAEPQNVETKVTAEEAAKNAETAAKEAEEAAKAAAEAAKKAEEAAKKAEEAAKEAEEIKAQESENDTQVQVPAEKIKEEIESVDEAQTKEPAKEVKEVKELPFDDIELGGEMEAAVRWAYENGVTQGMSETKFGPKERCTRAQVVTFLWRAAGMPEHSGGRNKFIDVGEYDYFYDAALWAVEKGITTGITPGVFSPDDICSTAHIITFLYRAMGAGEDGWYEVAKNWAAENGLLQGTNHKIHSNELCPRGSVVLFLYRIYGK